MNLLRNLFLILIFVFLSGCNKGIQVPLTALPPANNAPLPTAVFFPTPTLDGKPVADFPMSLKDVERVALIASNDPKSAEYQSMKYVLNGGMGSPILYNDTLIPYGGILKYLQDNQLVFSRGDIPRMTMPNSQVLHYELWGSGRWYLVTGLDSFRDSNDTMIFTNIDNNQGSVIGISDLLTSLPISTSQGYKFYRYSIDIGVYRAGELYSANLFLDENFQLLDIDVGKNKGLEEDVINVWLSRIQTEILPDFVKTYSKR